MTEWRLCIAESTTGKVVEDLDISQVPSFGRTLNNIGALNNVGVQTYPKLDPDVVEMLGQPFRYTLILSWGNWIAQAGLIYGYSLDDSQSPPMLSINAMPLWDFLNRYRLVMYFNHNLSDAGNYITFSPTSPDPRNQNRTWAGVAQRLVEIAIGGIGSFGPNSDTGDTTGLGLPMVFPNPADNNSYAGSANIVYSSADVATVGQRISDMVALGQVECEFSPEWQDDTHRFFQWRMRVSDTRVGQIGYPWVWDYQMAAQYVSIAVDGTAMSYRVYEKGQDNRQAADPTTGTVASGALDWAVSSTVPAFPSEGWPWLITADTSHSSETNENVLLQYANAYVNTNQHPIYSTLATIRIDGKTVNGEDTGSPAIDAINVGDTAVLQLTNHAVLPDGSYAVRILSITQGMDLWTAVLTFQMIGTVNA